MNLFSLVILWPFLSWPEKRNVELREFSKPLGSIWKAKHTEKKNRYAHCRDGPDGYALLLVDTVGGGHY